MATREAVLHPAYSIRTITKMSICVALCCVSAYISIPLPFTTAMITALTVVMNLTAFILKPKQTLIVTMRSFEKIGLLTERKEKYTREIEMLTTEITRLSQIK